MIPCKYSARKQISKNIYSKVVSIFKKRIIVKASQKNILNLLNVLQTPVQIQVRKLQESPSTFYMTVI